MVAIMIASPSQTTEGAGLRSIFTLVGRTFGSFKGFRRVIIVMARIRPMKVMAPPMMSGRSLNQVGPDHGREMVTAT